MIEDLTADKCWVQSGRSIILKLEEQPSFGRGRCGYGFGRGECVENESGEGESF